MTNRAVILAAGRGSRLNRLTADRPKCLVELGGQPLLHWQLAALRAAGMDEIGVVGGYRGDMLKARDLTYFGNSRWAETNMVRSLACAATWLRAGPVVVSYADIFYSPEIVVNLMRTDADLVVAYDTNWHALWSARFAEPLADAETFSAGADGTLDEIGEKPQSIEQVRGQYMGLLKFEPNGWHAVEELFSALGEHEIDKMDMTGMLKRLIARGETITAVPNTAPWGEIDQESDLDLYDGWIKNGTLAVPAQGTTS
ncbi:MAG: phosphocholine cytidylyltransferase family protein [Rhodobacteraceae bacterium]|nr:phosphocholine cytidylyltransferase family protein [Paracoccaceae bacterium]